MASPGSPDTAAVPGKPRDLSLFEKSAYSAILLLLYYFFFVWLPAALLIAGIEASTARGTPTPESIVIPMHVKVAWCFMAAVLIAASSIFGGFQKALMSFFGKWTLMIWLCATGALFAYVADVGRVAASYINAQLDDNGFVLGYFATWILVVGYLTKQPWDMARDKWEAVTAAEMLLPPRKRPDPASA
ncbi:hypothetical protein [Novosphingobium sp.]|uniref:hypothetical protein n=1 Tax=Novosphingobium sp. TaxID=1874826 RepID=UPI002FDF9CE6